MKTNTTIRSTTALLAIAVFSTVPVSATRNFSETKSYHTGGSNFGASASFYAYDNYTAPSGSTTGNYSVTAGGSVTGTVCSASVTALSGNGTVNVKSDGTGTFTGTLSVLGASLVNVSNTSLPYNSEHYFQDWSESKSYPFTIWIIPCYVTARVSASVDAWFRVDTSWTDGYLTTFHGAIPRVEVKIGPVADLAASAEAEAGIGFDDLIGVSVGATGTLRLGEVALSVNFTVYPTATYTRVTSSSGATLTRVDLGGNVDISLTLEKAGINGCIDVWAEATLWPFGSARVSARIAEFSGSSSKEPLLGPVTYTWF